MTSRTTSTHRRSPLVIASTLALSVLAVVYVWAVYEGYLPAKRQTACTSVATIDPVPHDELVDQGFSPYCARQMRGEAWR